MSLKVAHINKKEKSRPDLIAEIYVANLKRRKLKKRSTIIKSKN